MEVHMKKGVFLAAGLIVSLAVAEEAAVSNSNFELQASGQKSPEADRNHSDKDKNKKTRKTKKQDPHAWHGTITAGAEPWRYILNARDIEVGQMEYMSDTLSGMPGVFPNGTNPFSQRVNMRGVNRHGINLQVDGARQIGTRYKFSDSIVMDPAVLKEVDIVPGTVSVVGNSGALGGSISYNTIDARDMLRPGQKLGIKLKAQGNSNNNLKGGNLWLYGRAGRLDMLLFGADRRHGFSKTGNHIWGSPGHNKRLRYRADGSEKEQKADRLWRSQKRTGGSGRNISLLGKLGYNANTGNFTLGAQFIKYEGIYPYKGDNPAGNPTKYPESLRTGVQYYMQRLSAQRYTTKYVRDPGPKFSLNWNTYFDITNMAQTSVEPAMHKPVKVQFNLFDVYTYNYGTKLIVENILDKKSYSSKMTYGFELFGAMQRELGLISVSYKRVNGNELDFSSETKSQVSSPAHDSAINFSAFTEYGFTMRMGNHEVVLTPGLRADIFRMTTTIDIQQSVTDGRRRIDNTFNNLSPGFRFMLRNSAGFSMFGSYTKLFRGPVAILGTMRKVGGRRFVNMPNLKPETGENVGVGVAYTRHSGSNGIDVVMRGFRAKYNNLSRRGDPYDANRWKSDSRFFIINYADEDAYGGEAVIKTHSGNSKVEFSYTRSLYTLTLLPGIKSGRAGTAVGANSGDKYTLNMEYLIYPLSITLGMNNTAYAAYDSRADVGGGEVRKDHKPGYYVADVYLVWRPRWLTGLGAEIGAYNVFNEAYVHQTASYALEGDYGIGLNIKANVSYRY